MGCQLHRNTQLYTNPGPRTIWDLRKYLIGSWIRDVAHHRSICQTDIPQMTSDSSSAAVVLWPLTKRGYLWGYPGGVGTGYPVGYFFLFLASTIILRKMLLLRLFPALLLLLTVIAGRSKDDFVLEEKSNEIIGRFFPILPPYHGVDFGANFNRLKSTGDTAYFVVRDSIVVIFFK